MKNNCLQVLEKKFLEIKKKGFCSSTRSHNTGIGKTFEDLLGKKEDNLPNPDFYDIEIKTQRENSSSYVTLFTKAPDYPKGANTYLRETYGEKDENQMLTLHTSIFIKENSFKDLYCFSLKIDEIEKRIYIIIKEKSSNKTEKSVYYSFDTIQKKLNTKIKKLAYVEADSRMNNGKEEFHYKKMVVYFNPSLSKFLELLTLGKIMIDIRIGVYHNPNKKNFGKTHDHGTGFRIKEIDLPALYEESITIE